MDKDLTKRVVAPLGVKTPAWMLVESDGMDIDAVCKNGDVVPVFRHGNWAF